MYKFSIRLRVTSIADTYSRLQVFVINQSQFNLDLDVPRLQELAILPSYDPRCLLPTLTNALALTACSFFDDDVQPYEDYFLKTARDQSHQALAGVDRLEQYILAQLLMSHYLLRMGRVQEAYLTALSELFSLTYLQIPVLTGRMSP